MLCVMGPKTRAKWPCTETSASMSPNEAFFPWVIRLIYFVALRKADLHGTVTLLSTLPEATLVLHRRLSFHKQFVWRSGRWICLLSVCCASMETQIWIPTAYMKSQAWPVPVIPVLGRQRQSDLLWESCLRWIGELRVSERPRLKKIR